MLSVQTIQLLVTSGVVGAVIGFLVGIPYLKKKGVDVTKVIDTTENVIKAAEPIINLTSNLMPNNPAINVLKATEKWATIGAGYAEQLCHANEIQKDQRSLKAEEVVNAALKELGIEVDDNRKLLIDAAIKDVVNKFGHTEPTEAEKQAEKQALQAQVIQLTTENTNLKNTIAQVNATTAQTTPGDTTNNEVQIPAVPGQNNTVTQ